MPEPESLVSRLERMRDAYPPEAWMADDLAALNDAIDTLERDRSVLVEAARELNALHNGPGPDRDVRYQDAWRHGVADAQDFLRNLTTSQGTPNQSKSVQGLGNACKSQEDEGVGVLDPYICRHCLRVYAYLDRMGDPICECGAASWRPVRFSTTLRAALQRQEGS